MGSIINVKNISKNYDSLEVIKDWQLSIKQGERLVILGPSGSGKTTFLRIIAGLDKVSSGKIEIYSKKLGFVFQEPRLIPWRSVEQNLRFVNEEADTSDILKRLRLNGFEKYYPSQLSGGMQQRLNLARALIINPEILILDEAFSSLDLAVKLKIVQDLYQEYLKKKFTIIAVTHDLKEALYLADRILIISSSPSKILHDITIDLPIERDFTSPELLKLEAELLGYLLQA